MAVRRAPFQEQLTADLDGIVTDIDAFQVGMAGVYLGAGRSKTDDDVLDNVGVELLAKVGDAIKIRATVKRHSTYKGAKQTVVTRVTLAA